MFSFYKENVVTVEKERNKHILSVWHLPSNTVKVSLDIKTENKETYSVGFYDNIIVTSDNKDMKIWYAFFFKLKIEVSQGN
jgi:hypothetical protein